MEEISMIGLDLTMNVFQMHRADAVGGFASPTGPCSKVLHTQSFLCDPN